MVIFSFLILPAMMIFALPGKTIFQKADMFVRGICMWFIIVLPLGIIGAALGKTFLWLGDRFYQEKERQQIKVSGIIGLTLIFFGFGLQLIATLLAP